MDKYQKDSVYIGGGFIDSQLLYLIPIVHGYSRQMKIDRWIFERPISIDVLNNLEIQKILDFYNVEILKTYSKYKTVRGYRFILKAFINFIPAVFMASKVSRSALLQNKSWYECQLFHAVWDQALQKSKDGTLKLSFIRILESTLRILHATETAKFLVKKEKVKSAFMGHTVYSSRALLAVFKELKVNVYAHAANVLYVVPNEKDNSWSKLTRSEWDSILKGVTNISAVDFWFARSIGKSSYQDATNASIKSTDVNQNTAKNIILLHVFRDSPYNAIDCNRIFSDYVEWIQETLKIISKSNERWILKTHPSAARWGEKQLVWINAILNKLFAGREMSNIEISDSIHSNIDLFQHVKRVVTYHGTSHLEAACWGIKPIIIADASLNSYDSNLVLKPKSLAEYTSFLLEPQESMIFKLGISEQLIAKKILFVREEVLSFAKDVGTVVTYRGDDKQMLNKDFYSVNYKIENCISELIKIGLYLAKGISRSVSLSYADKWYEFFNSNNNINSTNYKNNISK
jgi:hypothetical protein